MYSPESETCFLTRVSTLDYQPDYQPDYQLDFHLHFIYGDKQRQFFYVRLHLVNQHGSIIHKLCKLAPLAATRPITASDLNYFSDKKHCQCTGLTCVLF